MGARPRRQTRNKRVGGDVDGFDGIEWRRNETSLIKGKHQDETLDAWRHAFALQMPGAAHVAAPAVRARRGRAPAGDAARPAPPSAPATIRVPAGARAADCLRTVWQRLGLSVGETRARHLSCADSMEWADGATGACVIP